MPTMNPALRSFWETPSRIKALYGGRDSSKSWDAAAQTVKITERVQVRVLCVRRHQNKIQESVYTLIKSQIDRYGLSHKYSILKSTIECTTTGSEYLFYGISRNIDEIKSTEGVDILWIEEAHSLTEEEWDILAPTIRNEGSEIWLIFNPRYVTDFVWRHFIVNPPDNCLVRHINYDENPFISETSLNSINEMKRKDYEKYEHIYLGKPLSDDEMSFIKRSWIDAAVDAHIKLGLDPAKKYRVGYDVANDGKDRNAIVMVEGFLAIHLEEWQGKEDQLFESCQRVYNLAKPKKAGIFYDNIGVGAGCGSNFKQMNAVNGNLYNVKYKGFGAGNKVVKPDQKYEGVKNKDHFSNLKAQSWQHVADMFLNTYNAVNGKEYDPKKIISISSSIPQLEKLKDELSMPNKEYDNQNRVKVQSKDELEYSPNLADAFIMAYNPLVNITQLDDIL